MEPGEAAQQGRQRLNGKEEAKEKENGSVVSLCASLFLSAPLSVLEAWVEAHVTDNVKDAGSKKTRWTKKESQREENRRRKEKKRASNGNEKRKRARFLYLRAENYPLSTFSSYTL